MTGLAREDQDLLHHGRQAERLYQALSRFLGLSILIGPILFGVWFASTAMEDVKPLEPLPPPRIAPLPAIPAESGALAPGQSALPKVNIASGRYEPKPPQN
ncbi:MAG: hypothetical protein HYR63_04195 [Proteobacteria bacterium]|nr:hypothetical protein [Pseudomonadota bacterium]MBI3498660.1 hypothetical protein [Pseudomonadota bacterium]